MSRTCKNKWAFTATYEVACNQNNQDNQQDDYRSG